MWAKIRATISRLALFYGGPAVVAGLVWAAIYLEFLLEVAWFALACLNNADQSANLQYATRQAMLQIDLRQHRETRVVAADLLTDNGPLFRQLSFSAYLFTPNRIVIFESLSLEFLR